MSDYNYVQYYEETGNVVTISTTEPPASDVYAVAKTEKDKPGDEFTYTITVLNVDIEKRIIDSDYSVLNNPKAARLLADNAALKEEKRRAENCSSRTDYDDRCRSGMRG
ncbi:MULTISPECIES: hypothetical protein [Paenibacillus]|uniref:Uncharacterized protein n=1 Tax=Paenibacillus amylolyticus TaxID=1451 RepID=A0ABD8AW95_PAEAM|nr:MULTISPECIES: hypothetical protein [Paenibacillus]ETT50439.1 hypothetical protein C170_15855 [Paenibacillus sp. FSL H7-689]OME97472.1 hypothetical protein BK124_15855 [Paenibacillus amylolyticus]